MAIGSPETSISNQKMHENDGEHSPSVHLPTPTETGGHGSSGDDCSKENLHSSVLNKDSACQDSSEPIVGECSQKSDVHGLVPETSEHCHEALLEELPVTKLIAKNGDSDFDFDSLLLYKEVTSRGGFEKVTKDGTWGEVASALNLKIEAPDPNFLLQQNYIYLLEQMYIIAMQRELPSITDDTGPEMSNIVTGIITAKIDGGYLITAQVGSQKLNGLLFDVEKCHDNWFIIIPGPISNMAPVSDPESTFQLQPPTPAKPKSKLGRKRIANKDPHAPQAVRTAYHIFLRKHLKKTQPRNIRKMVTDAWKSLSENERLPYIEASRKEKESCKWESSPDAPKKTRSAYQIFFSEHFNHLKKIHGITETNNIKIAADAWKSLSETERLPYIEESQKDRERYKRELAAYKEWKKETQNRNLEYRPGHSELKADDCYHVSLKAEPETGEFLVPDETRIAEHLMGNGPLLEATQMDWDFCESLKIPT